MDGKFEVIAPSAGVVNYEDSDFLYRQTHLNHLKFASHYYPKPSEFKPDPDGLSTNAAKLISIQDCFMLIGLTYKHGKTEFKDHNSFRLFKFEVKFLKTIPGILEIKYDPVDNGNPSPPGKPNNFSHTSVIYVDDEEIRLKLSDYCRDIVETCCEFDTKSIDPAVIELRSKGNNTRFHVGK